MSRLKALTENKYTLNDIFTKNYQIWMILPLIIYLLTPVVHMIVYSICYSTTFNEQQISIYFATGELPGDYYSAIIHYAFLLSAVCAVIAVISRMVYAKQTGIKRYPDNIPTFFFVAYLALIVVSTIVNKTDINYIMGYTSRAEGVVSFFCYYLVYYLCGSFVNKDKYKYFLMYFFLFTGVVIGILTLINKYVTDITIIGDEYLSGIFYTHNFYAYYLSISIMLAAGLTVLQKKIGWKIVSGLIFALDTVILAINDSMGGFLACCVAFLFLIVAVSIKKKKVSFASIGVFAAFLAIVLVVGLFTPSFFSEIVGLGTDVEKIVTDSDDAGDAGTARWTLWTHTAQYIKERPWFGWGFEGTAERLGTETHTDKAHNEYLENMAYYGIPAGLIYVAALVSVYIKAIKRRKHVSDATLICLTGALGYIGSALVGNSFIFTAPFCFIFLGLGAQTIEYEDKKLPEPDEESELSEEQTDEPAGEEDQQIEKCEETSDAELEENPAD